MSTFILVWVLVVPAGMSRPATYSPLVETLADCKKLQQASMAGECVQIKVFGGVR